MYCVTNSSSCSVGYSRFWRICISIEQNIARLLKKEHKTTTKNPNQTTKKEENIKKPRSNKKTLTPAPPEKKTTHQPDTRKNQTQTKTQKKKSPSLGFFSSGLKTNTTNSTIMQGILFLIYMEVNSGLDYMSFSFSAIKTTKLLADASCFVLQRGYSEVNWAEFIFYECKM